MYVESITLIDEGDTIAFIDDLQFEYEGVHEIAADEALTIDWMVVHKARVIGTLVEIDVTHCHTGYRTKYRAADFVKVLVSED